MTSLHAQGRRVAQSDTFEGLARAGHAARAAIYAIIGVLALQVALGDGGKTTDQQGALKTVAQGGFGKVVLVLLAIGVFGYALYKLSAVFLESEWTDRIDGAAGAVGYGLLCVTAVQILMGSGGGGGGGEDKATGGVLGWGTIGQVLVVIAGLVLIGVAGKQIYDGVKQKFTEDVDLSSVSERTRSAFEALGVAGHLARGVIFALLGVFVIKAAIEFDPDEAVGLDGALAKLAQADGGPILLGAVALGLICFAAYSAFEARFKRV
jgi:hypothetical protein